MSQVVWGAMRAYSTGDLACYWGSGKTFLEEETPSRSKTGEVEGVFQEEVSPHEGLEASEDTLRTRASQNSEWLCVQ